MADPGEHFGRLVVVASGLFVPGKRKGREVRHRAVLCRCDCGLEKLVKVSNLPKTTSCGCRKRELMTELAARRFTRHGASRHPLFKLWQRIISRCENPRDKSYIWYGARGISLCEQWHDPWQFITDVEAEIGMQPDGRTEGGMPAFTLDRIQTNGHYEPGNIRWADWFTQVTNRRPPEEWVTGQ